MSYQTTVSARVPTLDFDHHASFTSNHRDEVLAQVSLSSHLDSPETDPLNYVSPPEIGGAVTFATTVYLEITSATILFG
jgi:hypothetical protein